MSNASDDQRTGSVEGREPPAQTTRPHRCGSHASRAGDDGTASDGGRSMTHPRDGASGRGDDARTPRTGSMAVAAAPKQARRASFEVARFEERGVYPAFFLVGFRNAGGRLAC